MEDSESEWLGESSGNGNWILKKGLTFGKRILVAGFVVTSAPIVLPPLVVISAIGVACSVPYGLFLASYACTEKIMSKLLPCPTPSPLCRENGLEGDDDGEQERAKDANNYMEEQEELTDGDNEIVEGNRYREDGGHLDNKDEMSLLEKHMKMERIKEKDPLVEESQVGEDEESDVCIEMEGGEESGNQVKLEEATLETMGVAELYEGHSNHEQDDEFMRGTRSLLEKIRDEGKNESQVKEYKDSANNVSKSSKDGDREIYWDDEGVKLPSVCILPKYEASENGVISDKRHVNGTLSEEQRSRIEKSNMLSGKKELDHFAGTFKHHLQMNKEIGAYNLDAREIADESGLDLFDPKNATYRQCPEDYKTFEGARLDDKDIDSLEVTLPVRVQCSESVALYSEEMIWKQIDAMRVIVGYTAAPHKTCIEELKALYFFTGIEPSSSFKEQSDLAEANDKLRFLMSIIGVK